MQCPKCGGTYLRSGKRGLDLNKAAFGGFGFGMSGSDEDVWICQNCFFKWQRRIPPSPDKQVKRSGIRLKKDRANLENQSEFIETESFSVSHLSYPKANPIPEQIPKVTEVTLTNSMDENPSGTIDEYKRNIAIGVWMVQVIYISGIYLTGNKTVLVYYFFAQVILGIIGLLLNLLLKEMERK